MRKFLCFVVGLLLCGAISGAMSGTALAQDVSVYFDGARFATGFAEDGASYLPMRAIFQEAGVLVQYNYETKEIMATRPDGVVLSLIVGEQTARIKQNETETTVELDRVAYAKDGQVYVPLRFVAENLLCDVEWRDGAVWIEPRFFLDRGVFHQYWLTYDDGIVYDLDIFGEAEPVARLSQEVMNKYQFGSSEQYVVYGIAVKEMNSTSRLITVSVEDEWAALSGSDSIYALRYGAGEQYIFFNKPMFNGDEVFICDDNGVTVVNICTDEVVCYAVGDMSKGRLLYVNSEIVLLRDGNEYLLFNRAEECLRDLTGEILSEENKLRLETIAEIGEEQAEYYWRNLNNRILQDAHPEVEFVEKSGDVLRFRLVAAKTPDESGNWRKFDVTVKI